MNSIITIEYLIAILFGLYLMSLLAVWFYELRRNALYRQMKEQVRLLESLHLSMALFHIKMYKIEEDYRRNALNLEKVQQFIFKNVLLIGSIHRLFSPLSSRAGRR